MERIKYLSRLPNSRKLNDLALIGTHKSLSYTANIDRLHTQDFDIVRQLKYGIRVLHVEVHQKSNWFEITLFGVKIQITFSHLLKIIDNFLSDNSWEFVIMFLEIKLELKSDVPEKNCHIIDHYIKTAKGGKRLVKNWRLNDTIGEHRGKILLASNDKSLAKCIFDITLYCQIGKVDFISFGNIFSYVVPSIGRNLFRPNRSFECFIDNISYDDGINSRRVIARDGGLYRGGKCLPPINQLMIDVFEKPYKFLSITIADFVTQELMDKINDCNFDNLSWRSKWD
ncbi:GSCOCG00012010001-RA-CDS [Cotesia congregata]|nr:GSCOCG00012010001-RA-CDS [Cotesia congregata]